MGRTNVIRLVVICALLSGLTAVTFWPIWQAEFVNFDDNSYVTQNPNVLGGLTATNVAWAFKSAYFGNWHPITWLSHMLDVEMFGLKPGWHHLTNLLLHICNTCLLFWFLNQATGRTWLSAFVAGLFAVHPLHVESVAWISERKDVLSTFFAFLCLLAYLKYVNRKSKIQIPKSETNLKSESSAFFYGLALIFFALGLMSKAMIVTLPFLMLLLDYWPLRRLESNVQGLKSKVEVGTLEQRVGTEFNVRSSRFKVQSFLPLILEKLPFFALTFFFTIISSRALALTSTSQIESAGGNVIGNAFVSYMRYLGKTFWPINLSVFYPRLTSLSVAQVAPSVATVILLSIFALCLARRRPYVFVGWFWFLGTLAPVIALPFGDHAMADRYTYVPLIGIFIAIVWTFSEPRGSRREEAPLSVSSAAGTMAATVATILVIVPCTIISRHQLKYWRTSKDLLEHVLAVTGGSAMVHNNLGALFAAQGDWPAAEKHFAQATRFQPMFPAPRLNLARALAEQGKTTEAAQELTGLIPAWKAQGHRELAEIFLANMQTNAAIEQYSSAIELAPTNAAVRETLGLLFASQGKISQAIEQFTALVQLKPDSQSHYQLALSLLIQGKAEEAIIHYRDAIRLKPDWPEPLNDLAWLLATYPRAELRNGAQAVEMAEHACKLTNFKEARFVGTLDAAYAEAGRFSEAITTAEQAKNLASAAGEKAIADLAEERLKLYRVTIPFHQQ